MGRVGVGGGVRRVGEGQPGAPWPDLDRFLRGQGRRDRGYKACTKNMTTKGGAPSEVCFYKRGISAIVAKIAFALGIFAKNGMKIDNVQARAEGGDARKLLSLKDTQKTNSRTALGSGNLTSPLYGGTQS